MARVEEYRLDTLRTLWNLTNHFNVLNKQRWKWEISQALFTHEKEMVRFVQEEGYDQLSNVERWTFPSALMFALRYLQQRTSPVSWKMWAFVLATALNDFSLFSVSSP